MSGTLPRQTHSLCKQSFDFREAAGVHPPMASSQSQACLHTQGSSILIFFQDSGQFRIWYGNDFVSTGHANPLSRKSRSVALFFLLSDVKWQDMKCSEWHRPCECSKVRQLPEWHIYTTRYLHQDTLLLPWSPLSFYSSMTGNWNFLLPRYSVVHGGFFGAAALVRIWYKKVCPDSLFQ